jgi:hypothetical protein
MAERSPMPVTRMVLGGSILKKMPHESLQQVFRALFKKHLTSPRGIC